MDKLKMHTPNKVDENIEKIGKMFPNALTETIKGYNEDGSAIVERAINFDILKQELADVVVEGNEERYRFEWPDKKQSILLANSPISKTLRPCREESVDFDITQNLYIEGDNLDVLKLLQETYLNKVKMIYIDPPYNTGSDFVYEDDFAQSTDEYLENSGQFDEEGNRLVQNTESNGRFHTDWLNMIYPRLKLAKDLLTDDGVIFISIDDKEIENLKKICNEIFGENNFVSNIIWQSRTSISNDYEISLNHNHTIIYSKNREKLIFGGEPIDINEYVNPDNDCRGPWKLVPIDANHIGGETYYPITNPKTGAKYYPPNGRIWAYNENTYKKLLNDGRIKFGMSDDSAPKKKLFLKERIEKGDKKTPSSLMLDAGTTKNGTIEIMSLFNDKKVFDYPKPATFLLKLVRYGSPKKDDVILDFFSGSATTAHAVMQLNEEDGGNRKFIMAQLPEETDENSEAYKSGYKNICEIGKERIRRAGARIKEENSLAAQNLDVGFRVLKVDTTNMKDVFYNPDQYTPNLLTGLEENYKEDRTSEDLLFQVMLDLGVLLSSKIEEKEVCGKKIFSVADNFLVACFDKNINDEAVTEIAKSKPYYAVFRDSSMATDSLAANFEQIFATYSPTTVRKVL